MSLLIPIPIFLGALLLLPAVASRTTETQVVCTGPLPFSCAQLQEALRARWAWLGAASSVVVRGAANGPAVVEVGTAQREVDLAGHPSDEAARLVALLALDLALTVPSGAPIPAPEVAAPAAGGPDQKRLRADLALLVPFDQDGWTAHLEPTAGVAVDVRRGLGLFATAGFRQASAGQEPPSLRLREIPVRAGLAYRRRLWEVRLGGIARPYSLGGAASSGGARWGGALSGVAHLALTARLALVLAAGLDVFRNRLVFAINDEPVLTTRWLAPWVGAGLAWETAL